jgi:hypothetical protein
MRVEMDCKAERKGWAGRVAKWVAVNEVEPTPIVFAPRVCKRLKKKGLTKNLGSRVRKNIEIKGLTGAVEVGAGWVFISTYDIIIKVKGYQENRSYEKHFTPDRGN